MKISVWAALSLGVLLAGVAVADKSQVDPLTRGALQVKVTEVEPTAEELKTVTAMDTDSSLGDVPFVADWGRLIVLGKEIFEIIKQGAPVVNVKRDTLSVVPDGITQWNQLASWQAPMIRVYSMVIENGYRKEVVQMRLKVSAVYGGQVQGKGKYLANITIVPTMIRVGWGVNLDVWTEARAPLNVGTVEDPVAAIGMDVRFKAKTWVTEVTGSQDYFLRGDGDILVLGGEKLLVNSVNAE